MSFIKKKISLEIEYAKKVAMAEVMDFKQGIVKRKVSDYKLYNNDLDLMQKHKRFLSYIYSTIERYTVHRNIILYHYDNIPCTVSVLVKTLGVSRTSINEIILDSIDEKWILKKLNTKNKREFLISPTKLRLEFWSIYCKRRYQKAKSVGLAKAILNLEEHEDKKKL
jgi:DNA-binding MarR family transcriptional regulator